jgi:hydrogenase maturation factor
MCLAVPAEIKSIDGFNATVDYGGVSVLDREEAEKTLELFRQLLAQEPSGA